MFPNSPVGNNGSFAPDIFNFKKAPLTRSSTMFSMSSFDALTKKVPKSRPTTRGSTRAQTPPVEATRPRTTASGVQLPLEASRARATSSAVQSPSDAMRARATMSAVQSPSEATRARGSSCVVEGARPYSSPNARKSLDPKAAVNQQRLKGMIGRRYLSEALEPQFADPLEKCKCRFALCTVQQIFGDPTGLAKNLEQTIEELRTMLGLPEARDLFVECVEKLVKADLIEYDRRSDLIEEAIVVARDVARIGYLKDEYEKCKVAAREKRECEAQRVVWAVVARGVAPFLTNRRVASCVNRPIYDAVRALRLDESKERRKKRDCAKRVDVMFEPQQVDYPQCHCGEAMIVRWHDGKLVFLCRLGVRGCKDVVPTDEWKAMQSPECNINWDPLIEEEDECPTPIILEDPVDMHARFDSTLERNTSTLSHANPSGSESPGQTAATSLTNSPQRATSSPLRPASATSHPRQRKPDKKFHGNVFQNFLDSQSFNGGQKIVRIPKRMLMEDYTMRNQLTKLAHFSLRTKLECQGLEDKTLANQLLLSSAKHKSKSASSTAVGDLKSLVTAMSKALRHQHRKLKGADKLMLKHQLLTSEELREQRAAEIAAKEAAEREARAGEAKAKQEELKQFLALSKFGTQARKTIAKADVNDSRPMSPQSTVTRERRASMEKSGSNMGTERRPSRINGDQPRREERRPSRMNNEQPRQ